jgi:hypothetical protein
MSKVLIGIGDSFTQGQGGISLDSVIYKRHGDRIFSGNHRLPIHGEENKASWVNQICVNYLKDYKPINFGKRGGGNRGAVKELYLRSEEIPNDAEDIIVVYMLSGMERFDFVQRGEAFSDHHFYTAFPNPQKHQPVWTAYANHIYSDQVSVVETIMNICEAQTWCKANNAKLIITSAFDTQIRKENFIEKIAGLKKHLALLVDWDNFFRPEEYDTMAHMLIDRQENGSAEVERLKHGAFWGEYAGKFPCKEWITPCCHPTFRGHKLIARVLSDEIKRRGYA